METNTTTEKAERQAEVAQPVCPNCGQWQNNTRTVAGITFRDCVNDCSERGFAPNRKPVAPAENSAPKIMDATEAFAVPGEDSLIDCILPATGRTWINNENLEQIRERYPKAEIVNIDEFCKAKAAKQDSPVEWQEVTKDRYWQMLEVLPPACYLDGHNVTGGFLVGEPWDHHAGTGQPRYAAFINKGGKYFESNRPMTRKEFRALTG
jgi:hypothetical protein